MTGPGDVRDCFISHASEDKDAVARPLAEGLQAAGYDVWFDEYDLEPGDSLREKIDQGLANSRFGIVVLSRKFFEKNWTKAELDGLMARQTIGSERVILPVWHEIDAAYLDSVSPMLAGLVGLPSSPMPELVEKIAKRIDQRRTTGSSAAVLLTAQESQVAPAEGDVEQLIRQNVRVRIKYTDEERRALHDEGGPMGGPGWFSLIAGPVTLQDDLIFPMDFPAERLREIVVEDQWRAGMLLNREAQIRTALDGHSVRLPFETNSPPGYWLKIWQDGLMEFGEALIGPHDERVLPYIALAEWIHDYALLFMKILDEAGYRGDATLVAALGDVQGFDVAFDRWVTYAHHPIAERSVRSRLLRAPVAEIPDELGPWLKRTMDRFMLAAGVTAGAFFLNRDGSLKER
jgi:TIR domain